MRNHRFLRGLVGFFAVVLAAGALGAKAETPTSAELLQSGMAKFSTGDIKAAVKDFERSSKLDRNAAEPHYQLGLCRLLQDRLRAAEREFAEALKLAPDHALAQHWLQVARDAQTLDIDRGPLLREETTEAVEHVKRFLDNGASVERAVNGLGLSLRFDALRGRVMAAVAHEFIDLKRWDDALAWLKGWGDGVPALRIASLTHQGMVLLQSNRESEATQLFEQLEREVSSGPVLIVVGLNKEFLKHFGGSFEEPKVIDIKPPPYSDAAALSKVTGRVYIQGIVGIDGRLVDRQLVQGLHADLDANTLEQATEWRFEPARLLDRPARCYAVAEATFKIQ